MKQKSTLLRCSLSLFVALSALTAKADSTGWPANYGGVMLQGFYWDSYSDTKWTNLENQADELSQYFNLIWIPQSGKCLESYNVMGYTPYYYFNQNSSFGSESELRSMISTFKNKGTGIIADVVINHHNTSGWFSFPAETYNGTTYQFQSTDIVKNDDSGSTLTEATSEGVSLSNNADEGEDWSGMRDLDHKSSNVQTIVKAYENFLLNDLGYTGFRYDMVKGFYGSHVADYNDAANVEYSVGEYWDGNVSAVKKWVDSTSSKSAAFDFPFRYTVRDAINNSNWKNLGNSSLMSTNGYSRYAVTFVENHDTQYRSSDYTGDPISKDTIAANAFMLAMPGTPCVFLPHWQKYKKEIKNMILLRKMAGITNTSSSSNLASGTTHYAQRVNGTKGKLIVDVGTSGINTSRSGYTCVLEGYHYAYLMDNSLEQPWVDVPSGAYEDEQTVTLTAISATSGAKLVYTTDGTDPTTSSTTVASGTQITIPYGETTLKVGLLVNGAITSTLTRTYNIKEFEPYDITVYVNTDTVDWNSYVNYHSWGGNHTGTTWPGDKITATKVINGKKWFYNTYSITSSDDYINLVFSIGTSSTASSNQTVDVTNVTKTSYFIISSEKDGTKYKVDKDDTLSAIAGITTDTTSDNPYWYTLQGVRLNSKPTAAGIYIHEGKKVVVK
jgi:alpha-amylase